MKFINRWSYGLANQLSNQLGHSHEKRHVYYYGLQMVIGSIVKFIILLLATVVTGTFLSTFTVMLFFALPRILGGGYHMTNYTRCMITSIALFMLMGFTAGYTYQYWNQATLALLGTAVFLMALPVMIKYAPADTTYKPITKDSQKRALKILTVISIILWAMAEVLLILNHQSFLSLSGSLGILLATFMISPAGYRFFDSVGGGGRRPDKAASEPSEH